MKKIEKIEASPLIALFFLKTYNNFWSLNLEKNLMMMVIEVVKVIDMVPIGYEQIYKILYN